MSLIGLTWAQRVPVQTHPFDKCSYTGLRSSSFQLCTLQRTSPHHPPLRTALRRMNLPHHPPLQTLLRRMVMPVPAHESHIYQLSQCESFTPDCPAASRVCLSQRMSPSATPSAQESHTNLCSANPSSTPPSSARVCQITLY